MPGEVKTRSVKIVFAQMERSLEAFYRKNLFAAQKVDKCTSLELGFTE